MHPPRAYTSRELFGRFWRVYLRPHLPIMALAFLVMVLAAAAPLVAACTTDSRDAVRPVVTVFGTLTDDDATSFVASLAAFERSAGIDIHYVGSSNFEADLLERVRRGDPPDLALIPQPGLLQELVSEGLALPYDGELAAAATTGIDPFLVDLATFQGTTFASWYSLDPKSIVWYSPREFRRRGLQVPDSLLELKAGDVAVKGSNLGKTMRYDQILHLPTAKKRFTNFGGTLDFHVSDASIKQLFPGQEMTRTQFTYQLSDHFPVWVQIKTDIDGERLSQIVQNAKKD